MLKPFWIKWTFIAWLDMLAFSFALRFSACQTIFFMLGFILLHFRPRHYTTFCTASCSISEHVPFHVSCSELVHCLTRASLGSDGPSGHFSADIGPIGTVDSSVFAGIWTQVGETDG